MSDGKKRSAARYGRWLIWFVLLLVALAAGLLAFWQYLPYQSEAARQIQKALKPYGIEVESITVESLSPTQAVLTDIEIGSGKKLTVKRATAQYDWQELRAGKVQTVTLEGVEAELYQQQGAWKVGGLEVLMGGEKKTDPENPLFDAEKLKLLLPLKITLRQGKLGVNGDTLDGELPLEGVIANEDKISASFSSSGMNGAVAPYALKTGQIKLDAALDKEWAGNFSVMQIDADGAKVDIPQLRLNGVFTASEQKAYVNFTLQDKVGQRKTTASLNIPFAAPKDGVLHIQSAQIPWEGGVVRTQNVKWVLNGKSPLKATLQFQKLPLAPLFEQVSKGRIHGTGMVSGELPITLSPDGKLSLQNGNAKGLEEGVITVSPELLPKGDSEQLETLRAALQNFNYSLLQIQLSSEQDGETAVRLSLEGRNPDALGGKQVKLNVNFTGDIIPLIQQSLLPINDPRQLLQMQDRK